MERNQVPTNSSNGALTEERNQKDDELELLVPVDVLDGSKFLQEHRKILNETIDQPPESYEVVFQQDNINGGAVLQNSSPIVDDLKDLLRANHRLLEKPVVHHFQPLRIVTEGLDKENQRILD